MRLQSLKRCWSILHPIEGCVVLLGTKLRRSSRGLRSVPQLRGMHMRVTENKHTRQLGQQNYPRSELAGVCAQMGKALGVGAEAKADWDSQTSSRARAKARQTASNAMQTEFGLAHEEGVCSLGGGECQGLRKFHPTSLTQLR